MDTVRCCSNIQKSQLNTKSFFEPLLGILTHMRANAPPPVGHQGCSLCYHARWDRSSRLLWLALKSPGKKTCTQIIKSARIVVNIYIGKIDRKKAKTIATKIIQQKKTRQMVQHQLIAYTQNYNCAARYLQFTLLLTAIM